MKFLWFNDLFLSKKRFSGLKTKKMAVNNLSINFYEDQVTGLLGHNGAGKVNKFLLK